MSKRTCLLKTISKGSENSFERIGVDNIPDKLLDLYSLIEDGVRETILKEFSFGSDIMSLSILIEDDVSDVIDLDLKDFNEVIELAKGNIIEISLLFHVKREEETGIPSFVYAGLELIKLFFWLEYLGEDEN